MSKWYQKSGKDGDVVISTRIRLARNLIDFPFPLKLSLEGKKAVDKLVIDAIKESNSSVANRFKVVNMENIDKTEAISLVERHLVSPDFISKRDGRTLLLIDDESVSIMINEEDHIRLQVMKEGFMLNEAYEQADRFDTLLDEKLSFAFDDKLGFLTQCPTNLGTGMRASLLLHLPALQESGSLERISSSLSKLGLVLRGTYGEGTKAKGALYQLSNQVTLGISEQEAIKNLKDISIQLIEQERAARYSMAKHIETLDMIGRSLGILLNAKMLSNDEFMSLISNVRLGIAIKAIDNISYDTINSLIVSVQPATIIKNIGENMEPSKRDRLRADMVRKALSV